MKRIMPTLSFLIMILISLPIFAGTFRDDFEDGNLDGWEIIDFKNHGVKWNVENGVLVCNRPSAWYSLLRFGKDEWRNYSMECDAKISQILAGMHSVGLVLRLPKEIEGESARPYADFSLWENKTANIAIWTNKAQLTKLNGASKGFGFQIDQWYRLKATANEEDFKFYIDGELLLSLSDSHAPSGFASLEASGSIAHFDNVVITSEDIPDNAGQAVSSSGKLATSWGQIKIR